MCRKKLVKSADHKQGKKGKVFEVATTSTYFCICLYLTLLFRRLLILEFPTKKTCKNAFVSINFSLWILYGHFSVKYLREEAKNSTFETKDLAGAACPFLKTLHLL